MSLLMLQPKYVDYLKILPVNLGLKFWIINCLNIKSSQDHWGHCQKRRKETKKQENHVHIRFEY